jgi:hypothetical protein
MDPTRKTTIKAALILSGFVLVEGTWVAINWVANPRGFLNYLGFAAGRLGTPLGWALALVVAGLFVWHGLRLPSVRANLIRLSFLKLLAVLIGISAGILEEAVFRRMLMDYLQDHGLGVLLQILASALAFGAAHGVWGLFGRSWRAALGATVVTGALGGALAIVYIASQRSVASCIVAHFLIDALMEPGLILAAIGGEMSTERVPASP